jgi:CheY-like chemotaxis protein/class 3 adenylate cyclase
MVYKANFVLVVEEGRGGAEGAKGRRYYEEEEGEVQENEEISFSSKSQSYCVCFVSMVDSTETTFTINDPDKIRRYYSIFINTMAAIARNFDAKIIKNTGTSLVYYFPKTSNSHTLSAFKDVIECGVTMMAANKVINMKLNEEGLPFMHYKISADYGRVEVARSQSSPDTDDLFGSTMNICAKINYMAPANGMVIGSDLYYIAKKISSSSFFGKSDGSQYHFKKIGEYSMTASFKYQYPVYSVSAEEGKEGYMLDLEKQIPKLQKPSPSFTYSTSTTPQANEELKPQHINYEGYQVEKNQVAPVGQETREIKELCRQQKQTQHEQQQNKNSRTTTAATTIMLVDDEPDVLLTYKTYLTGAGYNVDAFTDPREALMCFVHADPNTYKLVLMDIRMPNLNGLQLYYRLKTKNPNIKILFVSALDAAQEMISILPGIGLDDVIRKPVDNDQFISKVKTALEYNKAISI